MSKSRSFTLIELLVVIAIIAVLMAILMPALNRIRRQARTTACLTQLKNWALYFSMYTEENNGLFMEGFAGSALGNNRWVKAMGNYYKWDSEITCCPNATKPWYDEFGNETGYRGTEHWGSISAWGYYQRSGWVKPVKGSYGINGWVNNPEPGYGHGGKPSGPPRDEADWHWRTPAVKGAAYVPLFVGAQRYNVWPEQTDQPPPIDGADWSGLSHMARVCLNRHDGFVNGIFLDFSGRKIGLKELWRLKWHREFRINDPLPIWPDWMVHFKDY